MRTIETEVLGGSKSSGFRERQRAWTDGLQKKLLTRSGLVEERAAIKGWMEANQHLLPTGCEP
jgi:hypothetical protein